jgi:hypothetical protein
MNATTVNISEAFVAALGTLYDIATDHTRQDADRVEAARALAECSFLVIENPLLYREDDFAANIPVEYR